MKQKIWRIAMSIGLIVFVWGPVPTFAATDLRGGGHTSERLLTCVNEGGSCDGSIPCCQGADCVRNRCRVVPEDEMPILRIEPHQISRLCLNTPSVRADDSP